MKRTTKALKNPFVKEALSCCVQDAILELLQGDKELASLEIALAIDKMMEDMTVRLVGGGDTAIIEVKHPKGYEYPPIEITVKKIVDQFIKDGCKVIINDSGCNKFLAAGSQNVRYLDYSQISNRFKTT